jgi:hypothetical protein
VEGLGPTTAPAAEGHKPLAHEIEVQPVDPPVAGGVMGHLARDAVELAGASEHNEVVGAAVEVTP